MREVVSTLGSTSMQEGGVEEFLIDGLMQRDIICM